MAYTPANTNELIGNTRENLKSDVVTISKVMLENVLF